MTPIYASDRARIAGWYAYKLPPQPSRRVFWDGGTSEHSLATGFWCPYTGTIVDAPDKLIRAMPNVCLDGYLDGDEVIVTGLPKVDDFVGVIIDGSNGMPHADYLYHDPGQRASFVDEIARGDELLEGSPCRMVRVEQLPDEDYAALDYFRANYPFGVARHPLSGWTTYRSVHLVANLATKPYYQGRVREIHYHDELELIDYVTVWATVEKELKVTPLYEGDDDLDCPFWKIKKNITLYTVKDIVIGYE